MTEKTFTDAVSLYTCYATGDPKIPKRPPVVFTENAGSLRSFISLISDDCPFISIVAHDVKGRVTLETVDGVTTFERTADTVVGDCRDLYPRFTAEHLDGFYFSESPACFHWIHDGILVLRVYFQLTENWRCIVRRGKIIGHVKPSHALTDGWITMIESSRHTIRLPNGIYQIPKLTALLFIKSLNDEGLLYPEASQPTLVG